MFVPLLAELLNLQGSKAFLRKRTEITEKAISLLKDLVPRAKVGMGLHNVVQIDLRNAHQSDEHERVEVQRKLIAGLENAISHEYSDLNLQTGRRSKNRLKVGIVHAGEKHAAFELVWLEPSHVSFAKDDDGVKLTGVGNEELFVKKLNEILSTGAKNVVLHDNHGTKYVVHSAVKVRHLGGENNLTDVDIIDEDGVSHNISIKKKQFREIRSAAKFLKDDTYLELIKLGLEEKHSSGHVGVSKGVNQHGNVSLKFSGDGHEEFAVALSREDQRAAYFEDGSEEVEAVVVQSFTPEHFKLVSSEIHVQCNIIITPTMKLPRYLTPYMRAKTGHGEGVRRPVKVGDETITLKIEIVPSFQLGVYSREQVEDKKSLPSRTHVIDV